MRFKYVVSLLLISLLSFSLAQSESRPVIAETPPFSTMLGNWEGEGWSMMGPDQRVEFNQTEQIEAKAGGTVISVTGTGRDPETNEISFEAFATAAYNAEGNVVWTAYNGGNALALEPEFTDTTFIWGFDVEGGEVRYTITVEGDTWEQVGEFSPDGGETWFPNFGMTLTRVAD